MSPPERQASMNASRDSAEVTAAFAPPGPTQRKHQALVRHGDKGTLLKVAEILEALDAGTPLAEIDIPPGITIEPAQTELEANCREIGIEPPP